jgi:hypothetical protein
MYAGPFLTASMIRVSPFAEMPGVRADQDIQASCSNSGNFRWFLRPSAFSRQNGDTLLSGRISQGTDDLSPSIHHF